MIERRRDPIKTATGDRVQRVQREPLMESSSRLHATRARRAGTGREDRA